MEKTYPDIIVLGFAYTPAYGMANQKTTLFLYEEMTPGFAQSLVGLPVHIEHDDRYRIGTVVEAFVNVRGQVVVMLHITGLRFVNERLPAALQRDPATGRAFYGALSLGNDIGFAMRDGRLVVASNRPSEISICGAGNRPMTDIVDFWLVPPESTASIAVEYVKRNLMPKLPNAHLLTPKHA